MILRIPIAGILHMKSIIDDIIQGTTVTANKLVTHLHKMLSIFSFSIPVATIVTDFAQELYDKIDFEVNGDRRSQIAPTYRGSNERVDDEDKMAGVRVLMLTKILLLKM